MHPLSWITFNMFHQNVISVVPLKSWKVNWELSSIKCHSCTLATDISWTCLICKSTALIMKCEPEKPVKRVRQHCVLPMAIMVRRCGGGTRLPDVSLGTRGDLWPLVMSWECVLTTPILPPGPGTPGPGHRSPSDEVGGWSRRRPVRPVTRRHPARAHQWHLCDTTCSNWSLSWSLPTSQYSLQLQLSLIHGKIANLLVSILISKIKLYKPRFSLDFYNSSNWIHN